MLNVRDFGAEGNGIANDTKALQMAFDRGAQDGETVLVPAGIYLAGTLHLRSHLHLQLDKDARLLGSPEIGLYEEDAPKKRFFLCRYLLWGKDLEDVKIAGGGCIDGNGHHFWEKTFFDGGEDVDGDLPANPAVTRVLKPMDRRPCVMYLENCRNVVLEDFTVVNSPAYTIWLLGCECARLENVKVRNLRKGPNTDVADIDCCAHVIVRHCDFYAGDDCIAMKSDATRLGRDKACEDVLVEDCHLVSATCGIRIGFEGDAPIRKCTFRNLIIEDTRHGINLSSVSPGTIDFNTIRFGTPISECLFENITMKNTFQAIYGWAGKINDAKEYGGCIDNLVFHNITADEQAGSYLGSQTGCAIHDISFKNVKIALTRELPPQSPDFVPGNWASRELGAALTLRGVHGFSMDADSSVTAPGNTQTILIG